ncbi:hypothetical protein TVAG_310070 [Trichomonas vaginalis G3]|uniref:Uncharacterized protein n=1 Tax=Trichomonas vaginalis (strain ATCC PRA-98 / G3) TaxID=412133 RepID=A2EKS3_TRIV3|nr:hypothetical protein TVAGG3_0865380 [Trichomonas vaginalis G3]EAY06720.1 hypothetical protein TVAG_310070 [Trichomonas vaginalis G3]KAI5500986.1 hypothetical protein TVAGG3_0865380 [Trichomonas vaginalis G3]|eukprot:XP_001318943.1 hypothetical protein [Trichomonas vaginalis G3]
MCKEEDEVVQDKDQKYINYDDSKSGKQAKDYPEPGNCPIPPSELVTIPEHESKVDEDPLHLKDMTEFHDLKLSD